MSDVESASAFAAKVRATHRSSQGLTAIGNGLMAAGAALERLRDEAVRKVVDVSGDGMANIGIPCAEARDNLLAKGVTINGLVIINDKPWVDGYYSARTWSAAPMPSSCRWTTTRASQGRSDRN